MVTEATKEQRTTLITTKQLAGRLGMKPATLANWRWRGYGPPHVNLGGRRVRYRLRDVEAWLERQVQGAPGGRQPSDPGTPRRPEVTNDPAMPAAAGPGSQSERGITGHG